MIVESIQKKKKGIYMLYLDNGDSIEMVDEILFRYGYKVGDSIEYDIHKAIEDSAYYLAKQKTIQYLKTKNRSLFEIKMHIQKDFSDTVVEKILVFVKEYELANDDVFAENYILQSIERGLGEIKIKYELRRKGIEDARIDYYMHKHITKEASYKRAYQVAEKRIKNETKDEKTYSKIGRYLASKGYENDVIYKVLNNIFADLTRT